MESERDSVCLCVPRTNKYVVQSHSLPSIYVVELLQTELAHKLKSVFMGMHAFWDSYQDVHKYCSRVLKGRGATN